MKFALVNGQRQEAQPKLLGQCPACGAPVVAKCGDVRVHHWAHKGRLDCDPWWENETEWHRAWKDQFPTDWQERICDAEDGQRHRADVKTDRGRVIEFQHSHLNPAERQSREAFYKPLVWVVDGTRRKRDAKQFDDAVKTGVRLPLNFPLIQVRADASALLRDWAGSPAPVLFDFGGDLPLWWLIAGRPDGPAYVGPIPRASFLDMHRGTPGARDFDDLVKTLAELVVVWETSRRTQASTPPRFDILQLRRRRRGRL